MHEAWFDTGTGTIAIGEQAIEQLVTQVGHMAVPLQDLLTSHTFEFTVGDFDRISANKDNFSADDGIAVGKAMARMLIFSDSTIPMTNEHIRRMNILGLLPEINFIKRRYGSLSEYRKLIRATRPRESSNYDSMPLSSLFEMVYEEHEQSNPGNPITLKELQYLHYSAKLPSYDYLHHRFGGVSKLNEYLGYPDIRNWDLSDYIAYGVRVIDTNGPQTLTVKNIITLAQQNFGPYPQAIKQRFGNWEIYKNLVCEELLKHHAKQEAKTAAIARHFEEHAYPHHTHHSALYKQQVWAKYHVAIDCLRAPNALMAVELSLLHTTEFMKAIQIARPDISLANIEIVALSLDVFDDLWPSPSKDHRPYL